ncbi:MAG: hypothetical protein R2734_04200 [Nocardioides sp.]
MAAAVVLPGRWTMLAAVLASAGLAGLVLWRRHRATRNARQVTAPETCDLLAGELAAGMPSARALARAADDRPELWPVVEAQELGSSVLEALRRLVALPGAGDSVARRRPGRWRTEVALGCALR